MSVPKQVQDQLDEAERIQAEILAAQQPAVEEPTPPEPEPTVEDAAPVAEPVAEPVVEPEPTPPTVSEEAWERRFKTLKGKYDAEVPRLHHELKELRASIETLTKVKEAAPQAEPRKPRVNEKDVETFGSDLIDLVDRKAQDVAEGLVAEKVSRLEAENQELRKQLDGVAERQVGQDQRGYFADLTRQVPDWEAVNVEPDFLEWLAEVEPLSGEPRQAYLNSAFAANDANRTAALFNMYKQTKAPAPAPARNRQELERQVAPSPSRATPTNPTQSASEKVWSMAEIDTFFLDLAKGKYRDKLDDAKRIENEIDLAVAAGRVRQ